MFLSATRCALATAHTRRVADVAGPRMRMLVVGINPSPWSADVGAHFARPGNRFWPALRTAGILDRVVVAANGLRPEDKAHLIARGIGITNLVGRPTAQAGELSDAEVRAGAAEVARKVCEWRPDVVAFLGLTAYRIAVTLSFRAGALDNWAVSFQTDASTRATCALDNCRCWRNCCSCCSSCCSMKVMSVFALPSTKTWQVNYIGEVYNRRCICTCIVD
eukprot:TRINITY_DN7502_c0_g1_i2.p1 TRINITY_DN7502_c0_g1~~TRINITY_DN7502_c0_g1_i2.p1  ORF type:complete len:220 (+),score=10.72 TRINITY_DN7502_c0_g1_i2:169-828(+)